MATINTALLDTLLVSFESNALPLLALFATFPILIECDNVRGRDCQTGCSDDQVCCLTCSNDYLTWSSIENLTESFSCSVNCVNDTSCLGYHCRSRLDCGSSKHCRNWTCHRKDNCSNFSLYDNCKACGCQECCHGMCGWSDALCISLTTLAVFGIILFASIFFNCVQTLLCHVCNCKSGSSQPEGSRANIPRDIEIIDLERETDVQTSQPEGSRANIPRDIEIIDLERETDVQTSSDEQGYCNQQIFGYSPPHVPSPTRFSRLTPTYMHRLTAEANELPPPPPYSEVVEEGSRTGFSGSYLNHFTVLEEDLPLERSRLSPTHMHHLVTELNELPSPPPYSEVGEERFGGEGPERE